MQFLVLVRRTDGSSGFQRGVHRCPCNELGEPIDFAITEDELGTHGTARVFQAGDLLFTVRADNTDGNQVLFTDRSIMCFKFPVTLQKDARPVLDFFLGVLMVDAIELQSLPLWHVEFGPDFYFELKDEWSFIIQLDCIKIEIRFADRRVILLLTYLGDGVHDQ